MVSVPLLIWAYEFGPDAGYSGVPGEFGSCATLGCHTGTANSGKGSVKVAFPGGTTYTPGVKQHLVITIADPATTQRLWGFQLTARLSSNNKSTGGTLQSTDQFTLLMCASSNLAGQMQVDFKAGGTQTCPASMPLQYIEHSLAGTAIPARLQTGSRTFEFDWTPPSTNAGNIDFYMAGNAANGDNGTGGDNIYTNKMTLTPAASGAPPSITPNGVVSAAAFGGFTSAAPGSWIEIYGANLAASTRGWEGRDFNGASAPTVLDNVKATIGGQSAFIDYVSPGQVNAQIPSNAATGATQLTITTPSGTSPAYNITINPLQPGLLAPPAFLIGGKQYVVAQFTDGSFVLPPGSISGVTTRQAKSGETIVIYGVGFGPVMTAGNQNIPAGQIVGALNQLTNAMQMSFGGVPATLAYSGLALNFVGLYQFNVVVPTAASNDALPVAFTLNGAPGSQTLFTAVKN